MRQTEYYKQDIPELGDPSDITVVSDAIADGEVNQSGKIEYMSATNSGNEISLKSNSRMANNANYYNGMGFVFKTPIALNKSDNTYTLKVDNLTAQPFKVKTPAVIGDIITVFYDTTNGFVFTNSPIPKSSAINSNSEETLATSKAVKTLNDNKVNKSGDTITGLLQTTAPSNAVKIMSNNNQAQYIEWTKNNVRKVIYGFESANSNDKFSLNGYNNTFLDISGFTSLTARLAYADLGNALRLGYGKNFANISPENNNVKALKFFNESVGANAYFNLESNGTLVLDTTDSNNGRSYDISFKRKGDERGQIGATNGKVFLWNRKSNKSIDLNDDGTVSIPSNNLRTSSKDLVGAINENQKLIINNSGLPYDENLLYLNDVGTKKKDYFYLDRNKKGLFRCLKQTTETINSAEFFEEIDNRLLSDKFNSCKFKTIFQQNWLTIYENAISYVIYIASNVKLEATQILRQDITPPLDLLTNWSVPINTTDRFSGGWGASVAQLVVSNSTASLYNQILDSTQIYTVATTVLVPKRNMFQGVM